MNPRPLDHGGADPNRTRGDVHGGARAIDSGARTRARSPVAVRRPRRRRARRREVKTPACAVDAGTHAGVLVDAGTHTRVFWSTLAHTRVCACVGRNTRVYGRTLRPSPDRARDRATRRDDDDDDDGDDDDDDVRDDRARGSGANGHARTRRSRPTSRTRWDDRAERTEETVGGAIQRAARSAHGEV